MLVEQLENAIAEIRERLDQSKVVDVVKETGLAQSGLYRFMNGGTPAVTTLQILAKHFDDREAGDP